MKQDNLGFPKGILTVLFLYTIAWAFHSWAYSKGYEAAKCHRKHGYDFSETTFMRESK